jgi:hypothetical protein
MPMDGIPIVPIDGMPIMPERGIDGIMPAPMARPGRCGRA